MRIYTGIEAVSIKTTKGHQVQGVLTNEGEIEASVVVNAAGPYAGLVGKTAGLDIPVRSYKRQTFYTAPSDKIAKDAPYTIDLHLSVALNREGPCLYFGGSPPPPLPALVETFDTAADWSWLPGAAEHVMHRFPFMADVDIVRVEGGLHPDSPDGSAILGGVPEVGGLYLACGLTSQGVMHSPAVGRIMSEYILGIACDPAIFLLRLSRFNDGALQEEGFQVKIK